MKTLLLSLPFIYLFTFPLSLFLGWDAHLLPPLDTGAPASGPGVRRRGLPASAAGGRRVFARLGLRNRVGQFPEETSSFGATRGLAVLLLWTTPTRCEGLRQSLSVEPKLTDEHVRTRDLFFSTCREWCFCPLSMGRGLKVKHHIL